MAQVRVLTETDRSPTHPIQARALDLASRLPHLVLEARRVMAAVAGVHGRRRAGPGEAFWQFRTFTAGEAAARVDWRRSGRDDRLYVREREWEAAHSVYLWIDRSPSMAYISTLATASKAERAMVLGLAFADALVDAGERVGLLGLSQPRSSRHIGERIAERLMRDEAGREADLPDQTPLPAQAEVILITDALVPADTFAAAIAQISARGARGHVLRIIDPVEETFPFIGEAVLEEVEGSRDLRVGDAAAWGKLYRERFAEHGRALSAACLKRGWTYTAHRTDRPATEAALRLLAILGGGGLTRRGSA